MAERLCEVADQGLAERLCEVADQGGRVVVWGSRSRWQRGCVR